jgi:hypothetical protein
LLLIKTLQISAQFSIRREPSLHPNLAGKKGRQMDWEYHSEKFTGVYPMTITLDGSSLTIEKLVAIARHGVKVELAPTALERIKVCRAMLEEKLANKQVMYGTNTAIGEFSETMLNDEQVKEFKKYLIYNHPAGDRRGA